MAWTDEMVDQLRAMWADGLTTGEIGKRLGVSKNSIVGKVHRLGLSGRPSPIKKKEVDPSAEASAKPIKEKVQKEKIEVKAPKAKIEKTVAESSSTSKPQINTRIEASASTSPRHNYGKAMLTDLDNHTCRWPVGDPKDENFHFCGKKVRIGQTYCDEHSSIAYVKSNKK